MNSIYIFGSIGTAVSADAIRAVLDQAAGQPVTVCINSQGGDVDQGIAIYELLRQHPAEVTVDIVGWALSIASAIAMAGKRIRIAPAGLMMVHNPWTNVAGNSEALRRTADVLDTVRDTLLRAYARSGHNSAQLMAWMNAETWFDADQAIAAGFADEIMGVPAQELAGVQACAFRIPSHLQARIIAMKTASQSPQAPTTQPTGLTAIPGPGATSLPSVRSEADTATIVRSFEAIMARGVETRDRLHPLLMNVLKDPTISVQVANDAILQELARDASPAAGIYVPRDPFLGTDQRMAEFKAAASDLLLIRSGISVQDPHPAMRDLRRCSVSALAERVLSMLGTSTAGKSNTEIIQAALGTSDFPELLANTTGRALRAGYESAPATHSAWTGEREVADFKTQTLLALSEAPGLEKVPELGEYRSGSFAEAAESFKVETFGKIVTISRQALVNDDLQAFTRIPQAFGASARRLEADHVYSKLVDNPLMRDGVALFDVAHGNLAGSGAALSVTSLGLARAAMRKQRDVAGLGYIDPQPRYLIVPVALETVAEQLLASLVDPSKGNDTANLEWIRGLVPVADPRLDSASATAWYLAAAPSQFDTIVRAYLVGEARPHVEEDQEFKRDALSYKCRLDLGIGVIDYRGLYKNPGA